MPSQSRRCALHLGDRGFPGQRGGPLLHDAGPRACRGIPRCGRIAQLVEQLTLNQRVQGSSPCAPTNEIKDFSPSFPAEIAVTCLRGNVSGNKLQVSCPTTRVRTSLEGDRALWGREAT
jgi:hypothetical protein